jgi:hypothetical protein
LGERSPEVLDASCQRLEMAALNAVRFVLLALTSHLGEPTFKLAATGLEFSKCERLCLVGIDQPLDAALDPRMAPSKVAPLRLSFTATEPAIAEALNSVP